MPRYRRLYLLVVHFELLQHSKSPTSNQSLRMLFAFRPHSPDFKVKLLAYEAYIDRIAAFIALTGAELDFFALV